MPGNPLDMKIDYQDAIVRLVNPETGEDVLQETLEKTSFATARPSFFSSAEEQPNGQGFKGDQGSNMVLISDLNWYTTSKDLIEEASKAGVTLRDTDITFAEHKVNGKTKGSVTVTLFSHGACERLVQWFSENLFQGKKVHASYFNPAMPHIPKVPTPNMHNGRPLIGTQALLAHGPTNAHGGINFNRVRQTYRTNQQTLGMGRPNPGRPKDSGMTGPGGAGGPLQVYNQGHDWDATHDLRPVAQPFVPFVSGGEFTGTIHAARGDLAYTIGFQTVYPSLYHPEYAYV